LILDRAALLALIPQRDPFFLLDGVLAHEPGATLTAVKHIDPADPVLAGHFPGDPIYPGVLLLEALAQAVVALLMLDPANAGRRFLFGGANEVRFRRPVRPGETVTLEVKLTRRTATAAVAEARALVDGTWVARAELIAGSTVVA
jgi:3-hydroxyacyl-[acyl-carrier-protein] dehydratase